MGAIRIQNAIPTPPSEHKIWRAKLLRHGIPKQRANFTPLRWKLWFFIYLFLYEAHHKALKRAKQRVGKGAKKNSIHLNFIRHEQHENNLLILHKY